MIEGILRLLFPPRCVLCRTMLSDRQTDLCHECRSNAPIYTKLKFKPSFIARWTGLWYYRDNPRKSILRYKFGGKRHYVGAYARLLAIRLQTDRMDDFDILTWVPVSSLRRFRRGYDQVEILAKALGQEMNTVPVKTLKKIRNTPPQSKLSAARRRGNVLGAYRAVNPAAFAGKRVLLLDDVLTTGATASECAKTLLTAGAAEVSFACLGVTEQKS